MCADDCGYSRDVGQQSCDAAGLSCGSKTDSDAQNSLQQGWDLQVTRNQPSTCDVMPQLGDMLCWCSLCVQATYTGFGDITAESVFKVGVPQQHRWRRARSTAPTVGLFV